MQCNACLIWNHKYDFRPKLHNPKFNNCHFYYIHFEIHLGWFLPSHSHWLWKRCNLEQKSVILWHIALLRANQIARMTSYFKMDLINWFIVTTSQHQIFLSSQKAQQNPSPVSTAEVLPLVNRNLLCLLTVGTTDPAQQPNHVILNLPYYCPVDLPSSKTCYEVYTGNNRVRINLTLNWRKLVQCIKQ